MGGEREGGGVVEDGEATVCVCVCVCVCTCVCMCGACLTVSGLREGGGRLNVYVRRLHPAAATLSCCLRCPTAATATAAAVG
jgi:hypothetical protein